MKLAVAEAEADVQRAAAAAARAAAAAEKVRGERAASRRRLEAAEAAEAPRIAAVVDVRSAWEGIGRTRRTGNLTAYF